MSQHCPSSPTLTPASRWMGKPTARAWLALAGLLGSQWLPLVPAIATPAPAGSIIENQATGSFLDTTNNSTQVIESNTVTVTVAEVAGISVIASGNSGLFLTGNTAYFDFTIQNEGNDATQFFIPDAPSSLSGGTAGTLQVIAYDTDGSGANASVDLTTNNLTVGTGGATTSTLLGSISGLNGGFIPAGGTLTVRVPVTVTAANGQTVSVTLGNTDGRTPTQNLVYQAGTQDLYTTEDFAASGNGEVLGTPLNGDSTTHRQEASASQSVTVAALPTVIKTTSTANVLAGSTATYTITLSNPSSSGSISNVSIQDTLPSGFIYQSTDTPILSGGATRTATVNPTPGSIALTWETFSLPAGGQVALTFVAGVDANTTPRTHQNPVTVNYTNALGQGKTTTYNPSTSTQEDVTVTSTTFVPNPTPPSVSWGNACASPGQDGIQTPSGIINTYYPGTASASAGSTTLTLGSATGAATPVAAGDLLLVIQMQDAAIDPSNNAQYGSGNANNAGRGQSDLASAGSYEYAIAKTSVNASGSVELKFPLTQTYTTAEATTTQGQKRFQVVRVPQYQAATLSNAVTALPWNGQTGGIVALDTAKTLTFSGGQIVATGAGFRGAGGRNSGGSGVATAAVNRDYVSGSANAYHGSKGEGIAGTPKYTRTVVSIDSSGTVMAGTTVAAPSASEGYPGGSFGRGAPGNAGGGGTDPKQQTNAANTGGGGGANYGAGGKGGDSWYDGFSRQPFGGLGGAPFPTSVNRLVLGGGGGAATANNSASGTLPSGGSGGGIILVRAGSIVGSGSIEANGIAGVTPAGTDGGGAGGAGGTVLIQSAAATSPTLTISAKGGNGNNAGYRDHGPGGGGGGGYVAYQGLTPTVDVSGGNSGLDQAGSGNSYGFSDDYEDPGPDPYGATAGQGGQAESVTIPAAGVVSGSHCLQPIVLLSKRITAITSNNVDTPFTTVFNATSIPSDPSATNPFWPTNYLQGGGVSDAGANPADPVDSFALKPGDEIEFTIYFLSAGKAQAETVQLCDRIPDHQTFVPHGYNAITAAPGASGGDRGMAVSYEGDYLSYTNSSDGDTAQFYPTGAALPASCGAEPNVSGAVVFNLGVGATSGISTNLGGTLPTADTTPASPDTSYGFVRFRAKVN